MTLHPTINQPLTVKELAWELGVSVHYIYQMRACGFPMQEKLLAGYGLRPVLTATLREAVEWIEENNFHLIHEHGAGVINGQMKFCLQVESWTVRETMSESVSQFAA